MEKDESPFAIFCLQGVDNYHDLRRVAKERPVSCENLQVSFVPTIMREKITAVFKGGMETEPHYTVVEDLPDSLEPMADWMLEAMDDNDLWKTCKPN
jgi:hypothetical protein